MPNSLTNPGDMVCVPLYGARRLHVRALARKMGTSEANAVLAIIDAQYPRMDEEIADAKFAWVRQGLCPGGEDSQGARGDGDRV